MSARRPAPGEYAPFYAGYVSLVPETDVLAVLAAQPAELRRLAAAIPAERETHRYAPGKWSIRELLGHVGDGERVFGYRAFCIGRGEQASLPGFDENAWAKTAPHGHRRIADVVNDGDDALRTVGTAAYDAVVLDVMLPGRDGFAVLEAIRSSQGPAAQVPVLLLSASSTTREVERRAVALGVADLLSKPIALELLLRVVAKQLAEKKREVLAAVESAAAPAAKRSDSLSGALLRFPFPALIHHLHGLRADGVYTGEISDLSGNQSPSRSTGPSTMSPTALTTTSAATSSPLRSTMQPPIPPVCVPVSPRHLPQVAPAPPPTGPSTTLASAPSYADRPSTLPGRTVASPTARS